jgi:hypothetical protein
MMEEFSRDGWTISTTTADPCLFIIKSPDTKSAKGSTTYLLIHTDDADAVSESLDDVTMIAERFDQRFGITIVDPAFMLGTLRETTVVEGVQYVQIRQPEFLTALEEQFKDQLPKRVPQTPFPENEFLTLYRDDGTKVEVPEQEMKSVYDRGYQSLVGSLLWGMRMTFPECAVGVNFCCRMMSSPTELAMKCALHIAAYMIGQKHRGIRFNSAASAVPICFYDSSDKGDPKDSKAQYGHVIMMFGGPVLWNSKKHDHVGLSSTHNEYMAARHATTNVVWLRQLITEMGLAGTMLEPYRKHDEINSDGTSPTIILGDNDNATLLTREDHVTPGNKFIRRDYHYVKEAVTDGIICPRRVDTLSNIADIFTKPLSRQYIDRLRPVLTGYAPIATLLDVPPKPRD